MEVTRLPRTITRFFAASALACGAIVPAAAAPAAKPAPAKTPDRLLTFDTCSRVLEGDLIEGKKVGLIRLIGVIAPAQGEAGWREATEFTRKLALGKQVKLEICPERPNDTQQRLRAIVYLPDGTNLNTKVLRGGWARVLEHRPCHVDVTAWNTYEKGARDAGLGLWADQEKPRRSERSSRPSPRGEVRIRRQR